MRDRLVDDVLQFPAGWDQPSVRSLVMVADIVHPDQLHVLCVRIDQKRILVNDMQMPLRGSGVFRESEDVGIFLDKIVEDVPLAIDLGGALVDVVERAHVIKASSVVLVVVCQQDGVKVAEIMGEHLHPEVRPGVHEDAKPLIFNKHGRAEPLVPCVR